MSKREEMRKGTCIDVFAAAFVFAKPPRMEVKEESELTFVLISLTNPSAGSGCLSCREPWVNIF